SAARSERMERADLGPIGGQHTVAGKAVNQQLSVKTQAFLQGLYSRLPTRAGTSARLTSNLTGFCTPMDELIESAQKSHGTISPVLGEFWEGDNLERRRAPPSNTN